MTDFENIWNLDDTNREKYIAELKELCKKGNEKYIPPLVKAYRWKDIDIDVIPAFSRHPCDLENEEWIPAHKDYKYSKKVPEIPLKDNVLEISNLGRIGLVCFCEKEDKTLIKGCCGCNKKCDKKFHYILPQREKCSWNKSKEEFQNYNGYLVVDLDVEEILVCRIIAESWFFHKNKHCNFPAGEIHHINNNGHENTPSNLLWLISEDHNKVHQNLVGFSLLRASLNQPQAN